MDSKITNNPSHLTYSGSGMDTGVYLHPGETVHFRGSKFSLIRSEQGCPVIRFFNPETLQLQEILMKRGDTIRIADFTVLFVYGTFTRFVFNFRIQNSKEIEIERSVNSTLDVHVHIPQANPSEEMVQIERIQNSIGNFLETFEYEYSPEEEPVFTIGSWDWKSWFRRNKGTMEKESVSAYNEMREALRTQQIDVHSAEVYSKRALATNELIASLEPYDEVIVRLGDVILAKAVIEGKTRLLVENVTPKLARDMEKNPRLAKDPLAFFEHSGVNVRELPGTTELVEQDG